MAISGATVALIGAIFESMALVSFGREFLPWAPMPFALAITIVTNFFLLGVYKFLIYPNLISPLRHIPGPKGAYPIIGQTHTLFETPPGQSFSKWMQDIKNDGLIRLHNLWNNDMLLVTSPAGLAEILVSKSYLFEKPQNGREHLRFVLGDGLVVVEGDEHKFQRKRLMPSFGFRHIKDLYPIMWSKAQTLCDRIDMEFQGDATVTVNISEWASKATLDAIGVAALGRDFNATYNDDDELATYYRYLTEPTKARQIFFAFAMLFGHKLLGALRLPLTRKLQKISIRLREICRELVKDKREAITKRGDDHHDILSVLIKSDDFSDEELVNQMLTFLAAGSDTTSLTFTWTCYLLAKYPHVQQKLREEITSVHEKLLASSASNEGDDFASILESLPYLNGVFHETLRLYPTVPMTLRISNQPTTVLGHPIPTGTEFVLSMNAINRVPQFWGEDAAEFKPERWIDQDTGKPNNHGGAPSNYCLLTFLAGPRSCIGQGFARAELRCLLAAWVMAYEMEDANPKEPLSVGAVTAKPMGGMWLRLKKANQKP